MQSSFHYVRKAIIVNEKASNYKENIPIIKIFFSSSAVLINIIFYLFNHKKSVRLFKKEKIDF